MRPQTSLARFVTLILFCVATATMAQVPPVSFQALVAYPAGSSPYAVAAGDFNNDGVTDLAVVNHAANNVSIYLGKGDGTFQSAVNYPAGSSPYAVGVADLNGDGNADLVVVNGASNNVSILLGKGDGTFQSAVNYAAGPTPVAVAIGDLNGDAKADLVIANEAGNTVSVLLGNGDGSFQVATNYAVGSYPYAVAVGDFNGDGKLDVVAVNNKANNISVLLGNGDGTLGTAVNYAVGLQPVSVTMADFNKDGKLDLAVANQGGNNISLLLGNGDGTFQAPLTRAGFISSSPSAVIASDFNADGKPDLAEVNLATNNVAILLGNGDDTFQNAITFAAGTRPIAIAAGTFHGIPRPDLAVVANGGNSVGILLSRQGTTVAIASSANPTYVNQAVTFTATVSPQYSGTATGTVTFTKGTTVLGTASLINGTATYQTSSLPAGSNVITAAYGGDTAFLASSSAPLTQNVQKVPTSTTIGSSLNPSAQGQTVTFTASVSSSLGAPPDGESVTFKNGSTVLATVPLSGGSASLSTSSLPAGTLLISASYGGDAQFSGSSASRYQTVNKFSTSTTVASSLNPSTYGQAVTFTATVSSAAGSPPDGEIVSFLDGGVAIGKAALSGGMASVTLSGLVSGTHSITASYPGDASLAASTSPTLSQVVAKAATTTTISSSSNPSNLGAAVTITATVKSSTGVVPAGTVTFKDGAVILATVTLSTSGTAGYSSSTLAGGAHSITAVFGATPAFQGSTSAPVVQNVYIPGGINFSHVSHAQYAFYNGNTATANVVINPGDTVIVMVAAGGYTFPTITSLTDSGGNTGYAQLANTSYGDTAQLFVWGALNVSNSASTLTVTFNHAMPSIAVEVVTYTGVLGFGQVAINRGQWNQVGVALTTQNPNNVVVMGVSQNVPGLSTYSPNIGGLRDSGSFVSASLVGPLAFAVTDNSATTATTVTNKVTCSNPGGWVAAGVELISPTL